MNKKTKMKVIQIYKPLQDDKTKLEDLELVGCVKSEMLKPNETYQEWLKRVEEKINTHPNFKEKGVEGIYFYDIQAIGPIVDGWDENNEIKISKDKFGMMVRYDYHNPNDEGDVNVL